ncbi:MFS transporter [Streptomyces boluensis]|uniref:MFS transporter n=1 Tax=Streptomyces boluensis TaxID=1775135 RepID=A0A964UTC6_9ACTN|nr:MFS transporter [Streptomyces boluensis]NBE55068.1 MFS transporter [Streptomyces boluensis]
MSSAPRGTVGRRRGNVPVLVAVLLALLILPTSVTGSGVALPAVGRDTGASLAALQWVVHGYNLTFASFLLACGSLADLWGRRRVFGAGAVLFTAASAVSATVDDIVALDLARALAGLGAAALLTSGSSLIGETFQGRARSRAFGALGIMTGAGLALGAMAAGVVTDLLGWRAFFGLHAVLMLLVCCAVPLLPRAPHVGVARSASTAGADRVGVDWAGTAIFSGGLFLLMLGTVEGPQWGWGSAGVLGLLAGSAVLLAVFAVVELRVRHPMLDLRLLRNGRFMALCLIPVVATCSYVILLPLLPNYLLVANSYSSRRAGTVMLLMTLPILVTPLLATWLLRRGLTPRHVFGLSLLCLTAGVAWLAGTLAPGVSPGELAAPLITLGVGLGLNFGLVDGAVLDVVAPESTGTAAGFLNTLRLGSEALAIAAASAALVGLVRNNVGTGLERFPSYGAGPAELANSVNAGDLTGPLSQLPAQLRPDFGTFIAENLTDAWQAVLWSGAGVCAGLSVLIYVLLGARTGSGAGARTGSGSRARTDAGSGADARTDAGAVTAGP